MGAAEPLLPQDTLGLINEGGITVGPGPGGIGWRGDGVDNIAWRNKATVSIGASGPGASLLVVHSGAAASGVLGALGASAGDVGYYFFISKIAGGKVHLQIADPSGTNVINFDATGTLNVSDGGVHCSVATYDPISHNGKLFVDGSARGSGNSVGWNSLTFDRISACALHRVTTVLPCADMVYAVIPFNRVLADSEAIALSACPWYLFAPDPRRLYFDAGAGGGSTFTAAYDETISLQDSISSSATMNTGVTETITLSDQDQGLGVFSAAFLSTINLLDEYLGTSGGSVFTGFYDETFTLSDSLVSTIIAAAQCLESITLQDSISSVTTFIASLQESIALQDSYTLDTAILRDCVETISLGDSIQALSSFVTDYVESLSLQDSISANQQTSADINETISLQSSFSATVPGSGGTVSETIYIWC